MASIRRHTTIDRSPDEVWQVVADAGAISAWFPVIEASELDGSVRRCTLQGGGNLEEEIVTSDDTLRRFQYRIVAGSLRPAGGAARPVAGGTRRAARPRGRGRRRVHRR